MKTIPWIYQDDNFLRLWLWRTEHFEAQLKSDGVRFFYSVTDLTNNKKKSLSSDQVSSFEQAEDAVKETIGKAYPLHLGYREYAGVLATTFRIYTGENIDFGTYEGSKIQLEVAQRNGVNRIMNGTIQVSHYNIIVMIDGGDRLSVPPQFIKSIKREYGQEYETSAQKPRRGRTVKGEATRGCTGHIGFMPNTVDHSPKDVYCPIHHV